MQKTYEPHAIENQWYTYWEKNNYFAPSGKGEAYCIMLPPPNVTGSLHMGHGFQQTLMDILIRYQRMCGKNVLWQGGMDHASIATQMVVERLLQSQNVSRHDLGREKFIERVWAWKEESGGMILKQMRRLGLSIDWQRMKFTMDADLSRAVVEVFIRLHEQGFIYRSKRLVNWDPVLLTALSDLEVLSTEEEGMLWQIHYPIVGSKETVTVATTRPETLFGDVAVAVHPDDERYQHLIGKKVLLPLTDREIPIIADSFVEKEFGTGCVKITPGHDFNDHAVGQRHSLPIINIFDDRAYLNENVPAAYQTLERFEARKKVVAELKQLNLLAKEETYKLNVPRSERTNAIVEPYLTDQWYVKMSALAEPAIAVVKENLLKFFPENWQNTYFHWLENIQDWCISRQLWWGHRIPVWYDEKDRAYVGHDEADVRKRNALSAETKLTQDSDVLDTWFSAALWPFSTLGWPEKTAELQTFYPTQVLVTGFDIIFFWVVRMVIMGIKFTDKVPFEHVYITGLIRDAEGQKMSKTKGNVLDPLDIIDGIALDKLIQKRTYGMMQPHLAARIEKETRRDYPDGIPSYGTDALRFSYAASASTTRDIRFDLSRVEGYRNFCNKLWNATRFVLMHVENQPINKPAASELHIIDRYILSRLAVVVKESRHALMHYRFDFLAAALYEFTWNEYCDWYVELAKKLLADEKTSNATRYTLVYVLEVLLRLLHPIMPFITEEIWQKIKPLLGIQGETIMLQPYPEFSADQVDAEALSDVAWLQTLTTTLRTLRSQLNIPMSKTISVLVSDGNAKDDVRLEKYAAFISNLARLNSLKRAEGPIPAAVSGLAGSLQVHLPMADLIDKDAELVRLDKEIQKLTQDLSRCETKLNNPSYVEKAPAEIVQKEKEKAQELKQAIEQLRVQREKIEAM